MTPEILLSFTILGVAVLLLVTEWIPMEVTALLALGAVALTGLVRPEDALDGFSNPAVVTVWAVFILSGGLTLTGVANRIGGFVRSIAGSSEMSMTVVIMLSAGLMSAVMNNVAVAALMLPVVMGIAQNTGTQPSRLLMPLAYGSLLGGLATQIGTPPNILVTDALRNNGMVPFSFFDFTPVGLLILAAGTAFMALVGRHLLPKRDVVEETGKQGGDWRAEYGVQQILYHVRVPPDSPLAGRALTASRIRAAVGLNVLQIRRMDGSTITPGPADVLLAGDLLTVEGSIENLFEIGSWNRLEPLDGPVDGNVLLPEGTDIVEYSVVPDSPFIGETLASLDFRKRFGSVVLALQRQQSVRRTDLQHLTLEAGDTLLVQGRRQGLRELARITDTDLFRGVDAQELVGLYRLHLRLQLMKVPGDSNLVGKTLRESRLGEALGMRVLRILRGDAAAISPGPDEVLRADDRLVVESRQEDLEVLEGLRGLQVDSKSAPKLEDLAAGDAGLAEVILSPQTSLEGRTLRQIAFREKYGLNVLALRRRGKTLVLDLPDVPLEFGDALLILGPRQNLQVLGREPDFIVLREVSQEITHPGKAVLSTSILAAVLIPVFFGWVPIYIAAVIGAALMILTRCLTMEEAYRQIEWKAVFLIAGMLPLGTALDQSGAAKLIAEGVVGVVGPMGPTAVMMGLVGLTFLATCFIPTAALVVLMAPIVFSTAADMNLSPHGLLMAVAMAASASFMTPISHPANLLVMGPGGYRFIDYLKVGGLLTLVVMVVLVIAMPLFWPL